MHKHFSDVIDVKPVLLLLPLLNVTINMYMCQCTNMARKLFPTCHADADDDQRKKLSNLIKQSVEAIAAFLHVSHTAVAVAYSLSLYYKLLSHYTKFCS